MEWYEFDSSSYTSQVMLSQGCIGSPWNCGEGTIAWYGCPISVSKIAWKRHQKIIDEILWLCNDEPTHIACSSSWAGHKLNDNSNNGWRVTRDHLIKALILSDINLLLPSRAFSYRASSKQLHTYRLWSSHHRNLGLLTGTDSTEGSFINLSVWFGMFRVQLVTVIVSFKKTL